MNVTQSFAAVLEPYKPQLETEQLIKEVNKLYHSYEADIYDNSHPEVHTQLPPIWKELVAAVVSEHPEAKWRILDFGCGTGFEAEQILRNLPTDSIEEIVCYDMSPHMLEKGREKIAPMFPHIRFCSDIQEVMSDNKPFNMLTTNSLLHHLPDPVQTIRDISKALTADAVWIAGHEPSSRYYKNSECKKTYEAYCRERRWRKYLSLHDCVSYAKQKLLPSADIRKLTAHEALKRGLFADLPPVSVIGTLVDVHVAHSSDEAHQGKGLDFETLSEEFNGEWKLKLIKSYAFMGPYYEGRLPSSWANCARALAEACPNDGANFCLVWQRA